MLSIGTIGGNQSKHIRLQGSFDDTSAPDVWHRIILGVSGLPGLLHLGFAPRSSRSSNAMALLGNIAVSWGIARKNRSCLLEPQFNGQPQ